MASYGQNLTFKLLRGNGQHGSIKVYAEEIASCNDFLVTSFAGHKLKNTDGWFAKSDPFIVIRKSREDGQWVQCWKSEVIKNNLNPQWQFANISVQSICNGDYDRPIRIEIYDWDNDGSTTYMGGVQTSLRQVLDISTQNGSFNVIEEKKQQKKKVTKIQVLCKQDLHKLFEYQVL